MELIKHSNLEKNDNELEILRMEKMILFAVLCNHNKNNSWKTERNNKGIKLDNTFIVGIEVDKDRVVYTFALKYWCLFKVTEINQEPPNSKNVHIVALLELQDVENTQGMLFADGYKINKKKRLVYNNDQEISLTNKEYELLIYFIANQGIAISREQVILKVWDENYYGSDRVVDDTLRRLRRKVPNINIHTIYGYGYRYD